MLKSEVNYGGVKAKGFASRYLFYGVYSFVCVVLSLVPWYVVMFLDVQNVLNICDVLVLVKLITIFILRLLCR